MLTRNVGVEALTALMPMHLLIDDEGSILSCGSTLRKLIGTAQDVQSGFDLRRAEIGTDLVPAIRLAATTGRRLFLAAKARTLPPLRGEAFALPDGDSLLNLGFGIGVIEAISTIGLTDADFAANELAIEMMYLHKSNQVIRDELSRHSILSDDAREAAELQAFTDPLTGLLNRRGFDLAFQDAVQARLPQHDTKQEFSLLHLDLDWFKQINDKHGHAAGDVVLQHVAQILNKETRGEDSVARIGGDEFAVVLPGMISATALKAMARRIIGSIQHPIMVKDAQWRVSVSIGGARSIDYCQADLGGILHDSDTALYNAKSTGKGCFQLHLQPET